MSENYGDAAQRHWSDAELLHADCRWPNADQLYGLAAECSLKAVMKAFGMQISPHGRPMEKKHRVHIDKLWSEFRNFATGQGASKYAAMLPAANPFDDWSIEQRYWHSSHLSQIKVQPHQQGAQHAIKLLDQARQDGMVT